MVLESHAKLPDMQVTIPGVVTLRRPQAIRCATLTPPASAVTFMTSPPALRHSSIAWERLHRCYSTHQQAHPEAAAYMSPVHLCWSHMVICICSQRYHTHQRPLHAPALPQSGPWPHQSTTFTSTTPHTPPHVQHAFPGPHSRPVLGRLAERTRLSSRNYT